MRTNNEDRGEEKKALLLQLQKMPIASVACDRAQVSRSTYYRWREKDEQFRIASDEAINDGELLMTDMTENQLFSLIKDKHFPAISLYLRKHHPKYSDRLEITASLKVTNNPMTPEQKSLIEKALTFADIKNYGKKQIR